MGLRVKDDSFCIFLCFIEAVKSRFLKELAELVASQLTQVSTYTIKYKFEKNNDGEISVYLDFITP